MSSTIELDTVRVSFAEIRERSGSDEIQQRDFQDFHRSVNVLVTGLKSSGKTTWMRSVYLHNVADKQATLNKFVERIQNDLLSYLNSLFALMDPNRFKQGEKERFDEVTSESRGNWSLEVGRTLQKMSRTYLRELKSLTTNSERINHYLELLGRITQPDYTPTLLDCLMISSKGYESDEVTIVFKDTEYNFYKSEPDELGLIENRQFLDNLTLIVNVVDSSLFGQREEVEKMLDFQRILNRHPPFLAPGSKFMTVPIVMLFNKWDLFERLFESRRLVLKEGFENFKGRRNIETIKEFVKSEFYNMTFGDREVFSSFKSSLSLNNESMISISKACDTIAKKCELSKILKLEYKLSIHRILTGEAIPKINLGNPDSHSRLLFSNIPWRDLMSLARALHPGNGNLQCTELNLRNNGLGPRGTNILTDSLYFSRTLTILKLGCNNIQDEGAIYLATMLERNQGVLTTLNINSNGITGLGGRNIALSLVKNTTLTMLDLSENLLDDSAAQAFVSAIQANKTLRILNLWRNKITDLRVMEQLYFTNHTLVELNLNKNTTEYFTSLWQLVSLLKENYTSALSYISLEVIDTWNVWNRAVAMTENESGDSAENRSKQLNELQSIMHRDRERAERDCTMGLVVVDEDPAVHAKKIDDEVIVDWGNFGLRPRLNLPNDSFSLNSIHNVTAIYLDSNELVEFPAPVCGLVNLRTLVLANNLIPSIPPEIHRLVNLIRLDLSSNKLTQLVGAIGTMTSLQLLDLRYNQLYTLCDEVSSLVNLNWLLVQQNCLNTLPTDIFKLTKLQALDCHGNKITEIKQVIYTAWVKRVQELDLSSLDLPSLPLEIGQLISLRTLILSKNKLISIPPVIGNLRELVILDLMDNQLEYLPWQIGEINSLLELRLAGNPLSRIPPDIRDKDLPALKKYLLTQASGEEECFRMKLMLVGAENVGKTSTSRCLREEISDSKKRKTSLSAPTTISTDGVDIGYWEYEEEGFPTITFSVCDFAGQEVYYATHQFFLTQRSLFIIVFNMMVGEETSRIEYWLQSIKVAAKSAPVLLVGTHSDHPRCSADFVENLTATLHQKYIKRFKNIKGFFPVSCKSRRGFDSLRTTIVQSTRTQPGVVNKIPRSYLQLERLLASEKQHRSPPILSIEQFSEMATHCGCFSSSLSSPSSPSSSSSSNPTNSNNNNNNNTHPNHLNDPIEFNLNLIHPIAGFLSELGVIIWINDPKLNNLIIIDPQWLAKLMATLITSKMNFVVNGMLEKKNLTFLWKAPDFPEPLHTTLINLLELFELLYRMPLHIEDGANLEGISIHDEKYLLMCLVNDKRPPLEWPRPGTEDRPQVVRIYQLPFVPLGLVAKLMTRMLNFVLPRVYWKDGMLAEGDTCEVLMEYQAVKNQVRLHFSGNELAGLVRLLTENFDNLIEGYYHIHPEKQLLCPHCLTNKIATPHIFSLEEIETAAALSKVFLTCNSEGNNVQINLSTIAPDLVMADLSHLKMDYKDITILSTLGEGAFGMVYKAQYRGEIIAFKQLTMSTGVNPAELYSELRREVWLSSGLNHPNIVAFKGICENPCGMAMEYMPHGNLYNWLRSQDGKNMNWDLRLKISIDLAAGMRFLHNATPKIIHRDFKSPNILMSFDEKTVCKISDFGASRAVAKCFGRSDLGNPSWLAPEVMKSTGEAYTEKADTFSFAIVLWELLSREHPYSEYPISTDRFVSKFEEAIIGGLRPTIPSDTPPEYAEIVTRCWDAEPSKRPSFDYIYLQLSKFRRKLNPSLPLEEEEKIVAEQFERPKDPVPVSSISLRTTAGVVLTKQKTQTLRPGLDRGFTLFSMSPPLSILSSSSISPKSLNAIKNSTSNSTIDSILSPRESFASIESTTGSASLLTKTKSNSQKTNASRSNTKDEFLAEEVTNKFYFAKQLDPKLSPILCLARVGNEMWGGCQDGSLTIWDLNSYQVLEDRDAHEGTVSCIAVDNKGNVWTGSSDTIIIVWDKVGKKKKVLKSHEAEVTCLAVTKKYVWSGSLDERVRVWDVKTLSNIKKISVDGPVYSLVAQEEKMEKSKVQLVEGDDPCVWIGAGKKMVVASIRTNKVIGQYDYHHSKINCMAYMNDQIWSCSTDGVILVWNTNTHSVIDEFEYQNEIYCLLPSKDKHCIYSGTKNKSIVAWNTRTFKVVREQSRHDEQVVALAQGADGFIWSGSYDRTACVWQESEGEALSLTLSTNYRSSNSLT